MDEAHVKTISIIAKHDDVTIMNVRCTIDLPEYLIGGIPSFVPLYLASRHHPFTQLNPTVIDALSGAGWIRQNNVDGNWLPGRILTLRDFVQISLGSQNADGRPELPDQRLVRSNVELDVID